MREGTIHCPNCGAGLTWESKPRGIGEAAGVLLFFLVGLPAALCGGCSIMSLMHGDLARQEFGGMMPVFAVAGVLVFATVLWLLLKRSK